MEFRYQEGIKTTFDVPNDPVVEVDGRLNTLLDRKGFRYVIGNGYCFPPSDMPHKLNELKWICLFKSGGWTAKPQPNNLPAGTPLEQYLNSLADFQYLSASCLQRESKI